MPNIQDKTAKAVNAAQAKKMGQFDEAPGGGTPAKGGGRGAMNQNFVVAESPDDPAAIQAKKNGQAVRYNQPRNDDGTFTYNSANGKDLSTEHSRGRTEHPFLNGVVLTFMQEGQKAAFTGQTTKAGKSYTGIGVNVVSLSKDEVNAMLKKYDSEKGGFYACYNTIMSKKAGTFMSKDEKTAAAQAEANPEAALVASSDKYTPAGQKATQKYQEAQQGASVDKNWMAAQTAKSNAPKKPRVSAFARKANAAAQASNPTLMPGMTLNTNTNSQGGSNAAPTPRTATSVPNRRQGSAFGNIQNKLGANPFANMKPSNSVGVDDLSADDLKDLFNI